MNETNATQVDTKTTTTEVALIQKQPSPASAVMIIASFGLLISFFFPWLMSFLGALSGLQLTKLGGHAEYLWAVPAVGFISMIAAGIKKGEAICGLLTLATVVAAVIMGTKEMKDDFFPALRWGAYLGMACAAVVLISSIVVMKSREIKK